MILILVGSCAAERKFIVTGLGYEPDDFRENQLYALPMNVLGIHVSFEKEVFVPGPYCDYAMKLLGIGDVQRTRQVRYTITGVTVGEHTEVDGEHIYSLNILEGANADDVLDDLEEKGLVIGNRWVDGSIEIASSGIHDPIGDVPFPDVTMESTIETRTETIYKTILTDTSFIQVPVQTEQLEQKTRERKAQEAARFILELRADRYYLAAGLIDPYPQGLELQVALEKLDELEKEYLSLFLGKHYTISATREYVLVPGNMTDPQIIALDRFSEKYGFNSIDEEGEMLTVKLSSTGKTVGLRYLLSQQPEPDAYNKIYYRIPEMTSIEVVLGEKELVSHRLPVFQRGALVSVTLK